jgi:hypothetical protein
MFEEEKSGRKSTKNHCIFCLEKRRIGKGIETDAWQDGPGRMSRVPGSPQSTG